MIKNLTSKLLCTVAVVGAATHVSAHDVDTSRWEGFHVGVGASFDSLLSSQNSMFHSEPGMDTAGFSSAGSSEFDLELSDEMRLDDITGSIEVGYDWALGNGWVAGVGADVAWGTLGLSDAFEICGNRIDVNEELSSVGCASLTSDAELQSRWSITGRVGKAVNPDTLVYALAGLTSAKAAFASEAAICENEEPCPTGSTTYTIRRDWAGDSNLNGVVVGGGLEVAFDQNWSGKLEYRYSSFGSGGDYDFADDDCAGYGGDACDGSTDFSLDSHSIRFVISRSIDLGGLM